MSRTRGATDLTQRRRRTKTRSDKGSRRITFKGKPVKKKKKSHGKLILYKPKRNPWDPLKFEFWAIDKMSLNGFHHFHKNVRNYMRRIVYGKNRIFVTIDPSDINTKDKFERFCERILWDGNWLVMMRCHAKNKWGNSPKGTATIVVKDTSDGKIARLNPSFKNRGLYRYSWWWKG
jgi:hypothetical protein